MSTHPVARYRAEAGLSQADLAERLGCSRWIINRIEVGARFPSTDLLRRLVALTGVSADAILGWDPSRAGPTATEEARP